MILDLDFLVRKYNLNISGVIHIGAHYGQEFKTYKRLGIKNCMFFEPLPHVFEKLKENINNNDGVILINSALGSTIGVIEMFVEYNNQSQSSSILEPNLHLTQYPNIKFTNKITVPITKLDSFINKRDLFNFINIDVQGYELEVLKGSIDYLLTIDYIMTEVNRNELYVGCVLVDELDDFLRGFGFLRVETDWAGGTWGDAFYIKNNKQIT